MQAHHFHNHNAYKHILVEIHSNLNINLSISLGWKIRKYMPLTILFSGIPQILRKLIHPKLIKMP